MRNLHRAMKSGATAPDLLFGGLAATTTSRIKGENWIFVPRIDHSLK